MRRKMQQGVSRLQFLILSVFCATFPHKVPAMTKDPLPYTVLVFGTLLWCAAIVLPPVMAFIEFPATFVSGRFYAVFSIICHQIDARSFHLLGHKLAVCARCASIYWGFFAGVCLYPLIFRKPVANMAALLLAAALPVAADVLLDALRVHASTTATRVLTGSVFGVLLAVVITPVFQEALNEIISPHHKEQGVPYESKT